MVIYETVAIFLQLLHSAITPQIKNHGERSFPLLEQPQENHGYITNSKPSNKIKTRGRFIDMYVKACRRPVELEMAPAMPMNRSQEL